MTQGETPQGVGRAGIPLLMSLPNVNGERPVTPKFRTNDNVVRDSKRKDKATTLARRRVRLSKYEAGARVVTANY